MCRRENRVNDKNNRNKIRNNLKLRFCWCSCDDCWTVAHKTTAATLNLQHLMHEIENFMQPCTDGRFISLVFCLCRVKEFHSHMQERACQNWASAWVNLQFWFKKKKNNLWAVTTKRHFNRALLLTLLFRKTWKIHYVAQVQPLNGLKSWGKKKSMAGRHCVKEGYELNMEAHKCNQPYVWLPAATPNQLIG